MELKNRILDLKKREQRNITKQLVNKAFQRALKTLSKYEYSCGITAARRFGWFLYTIGKIIKIKEFKKNG